VWKENCVYQALSLSLSLSVGEESREQEGRLGELALGQVQPPELQYWVNDVVDDE